MDISLAPGLERFVERKVADGTYANESEVVNDALRFFKNRDDLLALNETLLSRNVASLPDIQNLSVSAVLEATKSAEEDLKTIMNEVKAINRAKDELRKLIQRVNKDAASNAGQRDKKSSLDFSSGMGSEEAYHSVQMPIVDPESEGGVGFTLVDLHAGRVIDLAQLNAILDGLRSDLDSMSEMGEMESLRLQMAMDRLSKMMTVLSNIMKKISDTGSSIVQNLK